MQAEGAVQVQITAHSCHLLGGFGPVSLSDLLPRIAEKIKGHNFTMAATFQ